MTRKTVALIVVAIACGLAAIYVASLPGPKKEMVAVIVARTDVSEYVAIQDPQKYFEIKDVEKPIARPGFIPAADFDKLAGRLMKPGLKQGEQLTQESLLDPSQPLQTGMSILPIPVSVDGSGFFLPPGTEVDLVRTVDGRSEVFVEKVFVLAVDGSTRSHVLRGTALVQLDPVQVLKVAAARERGTVSFMFRPVEEDPLEKPKAEMIPPAPR